MSKQLLRVFVITVFGLPAVGTANAEGAFESNNVKFGLDWASQSNGYGFNVDIASPALWTRGSEVKTETQLVAGVGTLTLQNQFQENGRFKSVYADKAYVGLRFISRTTALGPLPYAGIGAGYYHVDPSLAGNPDKFGLLVNIGLELPVSVTKEGWFGPRRDSFYVQTDLASNFDQMTRLPAEPDLLNGASMRMGFRMKLLGHT